MKTLLCILLCAVLCLSLLAGCRATPTEPATEPSKGIYSQTLSEELRAQILAHYGKAGKQDDEDTVAGKQYYGTYNGYVVLMDAGQLDMISEMNIGGRIFLWGQSMTIVAYRDGQEYYVSALYEAGSLTDADLDQILENHKQHFATVHNWDYEAYVEERYGK